jgi:NADH-quinone oxidoreductase subunit G
LNIPREKLIMVSVMPCTAKRSEANRSEFKVDEVQDVDLVITTQELALMIQQIGLDFAALEPEAFDMPFGFKTGGGLIFGNSGGVSEAVLRYAAQKLTGKPVVEEDIQEVRGDNNIRNININLDGSELRLAVVHGLRNARHLLNEVKKRKVNVDFIEVMSCPGGCVGGSGQPVSFNVSARKERTKSLYKADKAMQLRSSQDNPYLDMLYKTELGEPCGHTAHDLLHTIYMDRSDIFEGEVVLSHSTNQDLVELKVCLGKNCMANRSDELLEKLG